MPEMADISSGPIGVPVHGNVSVVGTRAWLQSRFPFICRRVCHTCNSMGSVRLMLLECPIVIMNAYAILEPNHSKGEISKQLRSTMAEIVTPEMVRAVAKVRKNNT